MVKMPDGSQGSGVHYYKDGKRSLVLTAAHVVEPFPAGTGVNLWGVGLYGEHVEATAFVKKVGDQNNVDLAVLECPPLGSIPVPISKKGPWLPSQGDTLLSVGYPKGIYPPLVTLGYAVQMDGLYLDHTASVWFGNSGGPVVNTSLEVVGINVLVGGCEGGAHSDKVRAIRLSFIKDFVKGV
jgi:S1-C subfamily serine protease